MVFSSMEFIFIFLPVFLLIYYIAPINWKNLVILIGSVIFYMWGSRENPEYILLFIMAIIMNYLLGKFIENNPQWKKAALFVALAYNLLPLILFKVAIDQIVLPIGISFFTFQNLSYVLDVYRGKVQAEKSFVKYGAYISMFPQLIAGPIITYNEVREQLVTRKITVTRIRNGATIFLLGLGAKVLIANRIGTLWSDIQAIGVESITTQLAWMGIISYCIQLYFDFYGYSLMAIGLGRMMGFYFPRNFDSPYLSVSMSEFFRRWHMTLGNWFKEYVYFPLGGSRCSKGRMIFNLFVVWVLTSLWHGIQWNFLLWGMGIFVLIVIEKLWIGEWLNKHRFVGHLYVLSVTPIMWLTFVMTDWQQYKLYLGKMFPLFAGNENVIFATDYMKYLSTYGLFFVAGCMFITAFPKKLFRKYRKHIAMKGLLTAVFILSIYCMYRGLNDPFLYFRF